MTDLVPVGDPSAEDPHGLDHAADAAHALRSAIRAAARTGARRPDPAMPAAAGPEAAADAAHLALRAATERYVRGRRAAGDRPERMLVALKGELRETPVEDQAPDARTRLAEVVVRWGIAAYYGA